MTASTRRWSSSVSGSRSLPRTLCTLWAWASVFPDSFDLAAAQAVCDAALDVVAGLVDKSVLLVVDDGPCRRYRLPGTLRSYGCDQLDDAGATPAVKRRYREHAAVVAR